MHIEALVHAALPQGDVILEVNHVMLVQKVVHLWVHSFYYVVPHQVPWVRFDLVNALLHILVEVPRDYAVDLVLVVIGHNLQPIPVECLQEVHDLDSWGKMKAGVLQAPSRSLLQDKLHRARACFTSLFGRRHQPPEFQVPASVNREQVIIVDLGGDIVGGLTF